LHSNLTVDSDSGNLKLTNVSGPVDLSVDSGNIKLYRSDVADTRIHADSGNVFVQMPSAFAGSYELRTDSGNIEAPESRNDTNDAVKVTTDSGNIEIKEKSE
jgi:DUF4097 and DUF4098 domain-containing protein YvlB